MTNDGGATGWQVYLSGEIHSSWREQVVEGAHAAQLPIRFCGPVTDHEASDAAGDHLGEAPEGFWRDHQSSKVNSIRTRALIERSDIVVIRFGEKYRQWNAAFDAGYAVALAKPLIVLHPPEHTHALKEVDAAARAVCATTEQVVQTLAYVTADVEVRSRTHH